MEEIIVEMSENLLVEFENMALKHYGSKQQKQKVVVRMYQEKR